MRGKIVFTEEQRNFLLNPAARALKPLDAVKIKEDESFDRFKAIRFGWTDGIPHCPHCGADKPYELHRRRRTPIWRCRNISCGKDFSLTSATCFASRKANLGTILHAISLRIHEPRNALQASYKLGIAYKTSWQWAKKFALFGNIRSHRVRDTRWPYVNNDRSEAAKLVDVVNGALPRSLPEQVRADVAQDIILGVLSGDIDELVLQTQIQKYIRKHYRSMEWRFDTYSLDQPTRDGRSWHDIYSSEKEHF